MGAFFGSIHVRTENRVLVQQALEQVAKEAGGNYLLGPVIAGWVSVFPDDDGSDDEISAKLATLLAWDIFHLSVHDDDIFGYYFYRCGRLLDHYNSNPNYFKPVSTEEKLSCQGRPELFQDLLPTPKSLGTLKNLLAAERYVFESERMTAFVELLGLANALSSYDLLQAGDHEEGEIIGREQFVHIAGTARPASGISPLAAAFFGESLGKNGQGNFGNALEDLNKALQLEPAWAEAFNFRGMVRKANGDLEGALADYTKAIELQPDHALAYANRGETKQIKGDLNGALADFNRAIELKPDLMRHEITVINCS